MTLRTPHLVVAWFLAASALAAQHQAFEAASVKPGDSSGASIFVDKGREPGRLFYTNFTLRRIICDAYGVKDYQVAGPEWMSSERYNILATMHPETTPAELQRMMQGLLEDRLQLAAHLENREMPVYALKAGRAAPTLKLAEPGSPAKFSSGRGTLEARMAMARLAEFLSGFVDRPVIDATALTGSYEINLRYDDPKPGSEPMSTQAAAPGSSILNAVREQLGLRIESGKSAVQMLIVDRVQKIPKGN